AGRIDRHGYDADGNAEASPEPADEVGVGGRTRAELMIDVQDVEPEAPRGGELDKEVQDRDGIRAARDGHQNGFAAREHRVAANGALDLVARAHPASRPGAPPRPRRPRSAPASRPGRCA